MVNDVLLLQENIFKIQLNFFFAVGVHTTCDELAAEGKQYCETSFVFFGHYKCIEIPTFYRNTVNIG